MASEENRQAELPHLSVVSDDRVRLITARARVQEHQGTNPDDALIAKAMQTASAMPMVMGGEPTKLLVTALLCHEGKNNNNLVFRGEDLQAAADKITSPNLLPMDWNHSAVIHKDGIPKAIGVWYSADVVWDEDAYGGKGAKAIQAKGVVWAWAFPEYAQEMIDIQRQKGYIEFSMACIPTATESGRDMHGAYEVAIEPVFFTLSALNVPPGDPDAKGVIDNLDDLEDEDESSESEEPDEMCDPADPLGLFAPAMAHLAQQDVDLEAQTAREMLAKRKMENTNFPKKGENLEVSLKNSNYRLFPVAEAQDLKDNWPEIWKLGGNIRGNDQFRRLAPVARRGGKVTNATEEYAVRLREAWIARHFDDHELPGVVAQVKWLAIGSSGLGHMKTKINEAKERVKARRAARTEEVTMDHQDDVSQAVLEEALETNAQLKTQSDESAAKVAELTAALAEMTARAEAAELKRDAIYDEMQKLMEQLTAAAAELATKNTKLAEVEAEQEKRAVEQRWAARLAELPESYRAAIAKRSEDEQARFVARWSVASDEVWAEFKSDLLVGFADTKISYLKLSEQEGVLPNGSVTELSAKVAALIK